MKDLSSVATVHTIEGQLYEGGGLEKVMTLIRNGRHRKFRSQHLSSASSKKKDWVKLLQFLEQELQVREKLALDIITAQLMGFAFKNDKPIDGTDHLGILREYPILRGVLFFKFNPLK